MVLASAGQGQRKPLKLKQHIPVKSKVKQQLQQADALHEQRGKARKHRLQTALGPRSALLLQILYHGLVSRPRCWPFCHSAASCGPPHGPDSAFLAKHVPILPAYCHASNNANCHALLVGLHCHLRGSTLYPSLAAVTADTALISQLQTLLIAF